MFDSLGEGLVKDMNKRWFVFSFVPSLGFCIACFLCYLLSVDIAQVIDWWTKLNSYLQIGYGVIAFIIVILITVFLDLLQPLMLRIYEGYWSGPILRWLRKYRTRKFQKIVQRYKDRFNILAKKKAKDEALDKELNELDNLEASLIHWPIESKDIMPTRVGNILKSAEVYAKKHYDLDAVTIWSRLYFVLPDVIRDNLDFRCRTVNMLLRLSTMSIAFALFWTTYYLLHRLWALAMIGIVGFILYWICYQGTVQASKRYGNLIRIAFDLYRFDLYRSLHWPLPNKLSDELSSSIKKGLTQGMKLSLFLHRAQWVEDVTYEHPSIPASTEG